MSDENYRWRPMAELPDRLKDGRPVFFLPMGSNNPVIGAWRYGEWVAIWRARMSHWRPIETAPENTTVLTQHRADLYPTVAYRMGDTWRRETEGPEDDFYGAERHCPLYRTPTH